MVMCVTALIYCYVRKRDVSHNIILLQTIPFVVSCSGFLGGRALFGNLELMPVCYVAAQVIYILISYKLGLYDINDSGIDSLVMKGDTGFISFDFKLRYLGCNETAQQVATAFFHLLGYGMDKYFLKRRRIAQQVGIEHVHQAPQFAEIVFHRRAAKGHPMEGAELAHSVMNLRSRSLESLALVEDDDAELVVIKDVVIDYVVQPKDGTEYHSWDLSDYESWELQVDFAEFDAIFYAQYPDGFVSGYSLRSEYIIGFVDD